MTGAPVGEGKWPSIGDRVVEVLGEVSYEFIYDSKARDYDEQLRKQAEQIRELEAKLDDCRDEWERLEDYRRYDEQLRQLRVESGAVAFDRANRIKSRGAFDRELAQYELEQHRLAGLASQAVHRDLDDKLTRYFRDRDHVAAEGSTDDRVLPGSIVTIVHPRGRQYTFVLTARTTDSTYPTEGYSSKIGKAVMRKRVGDTVLEHREGFSKITAITPGFRLTLSE
ncbi:GreA/GreB family elongation factor [Gordonia otitidis]|uniref:GreA/GreB family elongation factor n=1 Tax=Gordonia otitidis TaxID=249058 RepID=UPI001D1542C5|nr:GreA/GreB family elongation factor [Gordonia otitidis]UEA60662.1 GreA/GreB family elongation factor [Gordonia otitidis]